MLHRLAVVHIRTSDCHPRSVEHLGQGGHGHAADAHQMGVGAGPDISMDVRFIQTHLKHKSFCFFIIVHRRRRTRAKSSRSFCAAE